MEIGDFMNCFVNSTDKNFNNCNCKDIPGGFQDINPQLYLVIGEILGNIMAGNMPLHVQSSIGHWLLLVGQSIVTFHAQQEYMEKGPGRCYDIANINIDNKSCEKDSKNKKKGAEEITVKELKTIKEYLENLTLEVSDLKKDMEKLKKNKKSN